MISILTGLLLNAITREREVVPAQGCVCSQERRIIAQGRTAMLSREQIDIVKSDLLLAMERDFEGCYTLNLSLLLAQDNGFGDAVVWQAFYELFSEGLCMFAITSAGLRFAKTGQISEDEIKQRWPDAHIFRGRPFSVPSSSAGAP